jgi:hypothetical protein
MLKKKIYLTFECVFYSISSKLLLVGFCRNLPATRGNAAQIHPQSCIKTYLQLGNDSLTFPSVFTCITSYFIAISLEFSCIFVKLTTLPTPWECAWPSQPPKIVRLD